MMTDKEYAKYVGLGDVRLMMERDWKAAGIDDQGTIQWDATTGFMVPRERFSDAAWAALANDPGIVFTGDRPDGAEIDEAAVNAARGRLLARQAGAPVLHAQDEIPAAGPSPSTPGARVQGSDATSKP
jgi:hypothetical protein